MISNILYVIIIIFILLAIHYKERYKNDNPCNQELTDDEYINHMITHHEVAVIMSESQLRNSKNPMILDILRNIIRIQRYEILLMKDSKINKHELNDEMSNENIKMDKSYMPTQWDYIQPNTLQLSGTFCDPAFFNVSHNKNMHTMTDAMYIQHMIPHHIVAVDMSKKILKTTHNDFIIYLAYRIIRSQQLEITHLYHLSKSKDMFESTIL